MRKIKLENYRDIFKQFSIIDIEKSELVLSALQDYLNLNSLNSYIRGIPIKELKCTEGNVKTALPILEGIVNIIFKPDSKIFDDCDKKIMPISMGTQEVTLTKDSKLAGLNNNIVEKSLKEIQLYISKNKVTNKSKISLTLSNIGLINNLNGEIYSISGKRSEYIEILKSNGLLIGKQIGERTKQNERIVWGEIKKINELVKSELILNEDLIISTAEGYLLNSFYKIKILKNKIKVDN